jgi:Adenylate and Guanylate cyclase catalytic domain
VNTASRMESNSEVNRIHCSKEAAKLLQKQCPDLPLTSRGKIPIKGKGVLHTYWVNEGGENKRPSRTIRNSDIEAALNSCVSGPLDDVVEASSEMELFSDEFSGPLDLTSSPSAPPEAPQGNVTDARRSTQPGTPRAVQPHPEQPLFVANKASDPEVGLFSDELSV